MECFVILEAYLETVFKPPDSQVEDEKRRQTEDGLESLYRRMADKEKAAYGDAFEERLAFVVRTFRLERLEAFSLLLALYWEYNPNIEALLYKWQPRLPYPTKALAVELFRGILTEEDSQVANLANGSDKLSRYLLQREQREERKEAFLNEALLVRKPLFSFAFGSLGGAPDWDGLTKAFSHRESLDGHLVYRDALERLKNLASLLPEEGEAHCIHVYGRNGNGKHFLIKSLAKELGVSVLFVRLANWLREDKSQWENMWYDAFLESVLSQSFVCLDATCWDKSGGEDGFFLLERVIRFAREELPYFILLTQEKEALPSYRGLKYTNVGLPALSELEKIRLWEEFAAEYRVEPGLKLESFANRYSFCVQGIRDVLKTASFHAAGENREEIKGEDVVQAVKQLQSNALGNEAIWMNAEFTWEDFVIDEKAKRQILLACNQVKYKHVVMDEWGFRKKLPYGKGVSVLFYGPPGTGKTMAAQVMASDLGIDLYRIDLSQLVSKYIGETEKNISNLFKKAGNANALLFFDEADAIFAKRSEVSDSNDRNANAMTAHLLQKLEDYDGIAILATNYISNIDDAFKRRIKHMVRFAFPTREERLRLWEGTLPKSLKCDEALDFAYFAEKFELSGSAIKEILLHAAYMAAAQGTGLRNAHIVEGIKMNFAKYRKTLTDGDFGHLS